MFVLVLFKLKHGFKKFMVLFLHLSHLIWHLSIIKKENRSKAAEFTQTQIPLKDQILSLTSLR